MMKTKNKENLLAIFAEIAKVNKQVDEIQNEIIVTQRFVGAFLMLIVLLHCVDLFFL